MFEQFKESLHRWNNATNERQKLQHAYLALVIVVVLVAGVTSLFNASAGHQLVLVAVTALAAFALNAVVWNILNSALLIKLSTRTKRK